MTNTKETSEKRDIQMEWMPCLNELKRREGCETSGEQYETVVCPSVSSVSRFFTAENVSSKNEYLAGIGAAAHSSFSIRQRPASVTRCPCQTGVFPPGK